jgi:hypothetical protein
MGEKKLLRKGEEAMNVLKIVYFLFLCLLFLSACLPTVDASLPSPTPPVPTPWDGGEIQPPAAAAKAREMLAKELDVPVEQVKITQILDAQWPDSCLGLAGPAEWCAAVMTPGFAVLLQVENRVFEYRTDREGLVIRKASEAVQ